jgi:hypothetical protein
MLFQDPSILSLPLTYIHGALAFGGIFTKLPAFLQHIAIMPSDSTTTSSNSRIGATEQPYSRLHALPPEIRDLIYAFAVVSPDHIPAGIAARKIKVVPGPPAAEGGGGGRSQQQKNTLSWHQAPEALKTQQYYRILPSQPPLSCTDRATRTEVLRIFYKRNTFLFRVTPQIPDPVCRWLQVMGLGNTTFGRTAYAGGAAKLIERVAVERRVRKACVQVQHVEGAEEAVGALVPVHVYRVVVGLKRMEKKEEKEEQQQQAQSQQQPYPSTSTYQTLTLSIHYEADLAPMCVCTLQLAASLAFPTPWDASSPSAWNSPLAAKVVSFAFDLQALFYCGFAQSCDRFGLCDEEQTRACDVCGKLVLLRNSGGMDSERGFGEQLLPSGYSRGEEGEW